ncbi:MAG: DUF2726 domain-containing protein [Cyanobacteria bacterium P01_A01_bin.123]
MIWIVIGVVILVVVAAVLVKLSQGNKTKSQEHKTKSIDYPYQQLEALFTPAERSFLRVLNRAIGERAKIFGKIRVADIITPQKGLSQSDWQKAFNKISSKHLDFVVCKNHDLSVICAIELDDKSHQQKKRQDRDYFLNKACNSAGLPLIRVAVKPDYTVDDIKRLLASYLNFKEPPPQTSKVVPRVLAANEKICPQCGSPMVARVAQRGSNAGKSFWGCSAYPKCKHTEAVTT